MIAKNWIYIAILRNQLLYSVPANIVAILQKKWQHYTAVHDVHGCVRGLAR